MTGLAVLSLLIATAVQAQPLKLAHIFSDHMVLQQQTEAPVWGWGVPGKTVTVEGSWGASARTKVADDGSWRVALPTAAAGVPYTLTVSCGKEKLTVSDVALGDVWICSGQSNMEMPMRGFGFQQIDGFRDNLLEAAEYADRIRVLNVKSDTTHFVQQDIDFTWTLSDPAVCAETSAVAYLFAKRLTRNLGVPVGIIVNAWGGSRIEPWMTMEAVEHAGISAEELAEIKELHETAGLWPNGVATCWNGRVAPIAGYAAKGFIWYQGCSNITQACYDKLQTTMVKLWREAWGQGDLPFIYALLAPYDHSKADGRWRPAFVRTQMHAAEMTPNSYAVCLETLGDEVTIHPPKKAEVADMMALRALASAYGQQVGMPIDLPEPRSIDYLEDGRVKILFTNVWSNLQSISARKIVGFELAGEDRVFHLADAEVDWDGQTVYVKCDAVPHPVAVRYSFRNWMGANLQTSYGIPVPPFRTDDWPL
jgi:sialate O-acetylesterase